MLCALVGRLTTQFGDRGRMRVESRPIRVRFTAPGGT